MRISMARRFSAHSSALRVPTIDLARSSPAEQRAVVAAACRDLGFFQVVGARVDPPVVAANSAAQRFFAQAAAEKDRFKLVYGEGQLLYGYVQVGAESADVANLSLTGQRKYTDLMESFQVCDPRLMAQPLPAALQGALPAAFEAFYDVGLRLQQLVGDALGVGGAGQLFVREHDRGRRHRTVLRVTRYPALKTVAGAQGFQGELTRISPHRDLGTLTLLAQDGQGGLEVQDPADGSWHPVQPVAGALVVNVGNMLNRWTNGKFRSSVHRVVPVGAVSDDQDRLSVIMFMNATDTTEIAPLLAAADEQRRFEPINVGEYIDCKLEQIFNPDARHEKGSCIYDD